MTVITGQESLSTSAEQRLTGLNLSLPALPGPFGTYAEALQAGSLFFLSGMLPAKDRGAKFVGRVGAEFDVEVGRKAAHLVAMNTLAVARKHFGSLTRHPCRVELTFEIQP